MFALRTDQPAAAACSPGAPLRRWDIPGRVAFLASLAVLVVVGMTIYNLMNTRNVKSPGAVSKAPGTIISDKQTTPSDEANPATPHAPVEVSNSIGMRLVRIAPGPFTMGSSDTDLKRLQDFLPGAPQFQDEMPAHMVRITRPFYLGKHEVTVGQFRKFVGDTGYKTEAERDGKGTYIFSEAKQEFELDARGNWRVPGYVQIEDHPVVCVSHRDVEEFCEWLTRKEGRRYRLPTEAEWEFCCRAGTTTLYPEGDNPEGLAALGNVADASVHRRFRDMTTIESDDGFVFTAPVGSFAPNPWGLYDMIGNVNEWCSDWYDSSYYSAAPTTDPLGPAQMPRRVFRGGGWSNRPWNCRPAARISCRHADRYANVGFRVVADLE
jgi:formylglycine-generating enzyme required for sulfatase activity